MSKKYIIILCVLFVVCVSFVFVREWKFRPTQTQTQTENTQSAVRNVNILENSLITSPLHVTGEALGTYYFEASFPVKVYDAHGTLLGSVPAQAQSDWMTTGFVPFVADVAFSTSTTATGTLVLQKDNPSGLPENDAQLVIPVRFK